MLTAVAYDIDHLTILIICGLCFLAIGLFCLVKPGCGPVKFTRTHGIRFLALSAVAGIYSLLEYFQVDLFILWSVLILPAVDVLFLGIYTLFRKMTGSPK